MYCSAARNIINSLKPLNESKPVQTTWNHHRQRTSFPVSLTPPGPQNKNDHLYSEFYYKFTWLLVIWKPKNFFVVHLHNATAAATQELKTEAESWIEKQRKPTQ